MDCFFISTYIYVYLYINYSDISSHSQLDLFWGAPAAASGAKAALAGQTGKKRKAFGVRMVLGAEEELGS